MFVVKKFFFWLEVLLFVERFFVLLGSVFFDRRGDFFLFFC